MTNSNGQNCYPPVVNIAHLPVDLSDGGKAQQQLLMQLDIYNESIFRTEYQNEEAISYSEISPLDLAKVFADVETETSLLPQNTLFCWRRGPQYRVGVYLPPAVCVLRVDGEAPLNIPRPPLIFCGQGERYFIYALNSHDWPTNDSPLYQAPFPNVHSNGNICPGNVAFPECNPEAIHQAVTIFFESNFNHDLSDGKSQVYNHDIIHQWLNLTKKQTKQYPLDDLQPAHKTVKELLYV